MNQIIKRQIQEHEERLKTAMLQSDVVTLDKLLSPELIFTNHFGQIMTKQDDLDVHRSGDLKIEKIELSEQHIIHAEESSVVSVQANIRADFCGNTIEDVLRFTRVWKKKPDANNQWEVIAAHSTVVK